MKKFIFPAISVFLLVLYLLSFCKNSSEKYEEIVLCSGQLSEINMSKKTVDISGAETNIQFTLFKEHNLWKGLSEHIIIPVEQKLVLDLTNKILTSKKASYVSEYNPEKLYSFGLDDFNSVEVCLKEVSGNEVKFRIGKTDFSGTYRYICFLSEKVPENKGIYKVQFNFDDILHLEGRFWIDPYIFPDSIFSKGKESIQLLEVFSSGKKKTVLPGTKAEINGEKIDIINKLTDLRHGSIYTNDILSKESLKIMAEYSDSEKICLTFYPYSETDLILNYSTDASSSENWNYSVLISKWTIQKINSYLGL